MDGDVQIRVGLDTSGAESGATRVTRAMSGLSRSCQDSAAQAVQKIGSMLKRALIFKYITKAFSKISESFKNLLMGDSEVVASLNRIKGAFVTAFAPIYSAVLPAIKTVLNFIAQFVSAMAVLINSLFGISADQAKKNAQNLNGQANATKNAGKAASSAAKSLAKFDEINQLSASSGGGSGASLDSGSALDFSGVTKVSDTMKEIFKLVTAIGAAYGIWSVVSKFTPIFSTIGAKLKFILGFGLAIYGAFNYIEGLIDAWRNGIDDINSNRMLGGTAGIVGGITLALSTLGKTIALRFGGIAAIVSGIGMIVTGVKDLIDQGPNLQNVTTIIQGLGIVILGIGMLMGNWVVIVVGAIIAVGAFIVRNWDAIKEKAVEIWEKIKEIWAVVSQWFIDNVWNPVSEFASQVWTDISGYFSQLWADICAVWEVVSQWFVDNVWQPISDFASEIWTAISGFFTNLWNDIIGVWTAASEWFSTNVWQPISDFASGIWTDISGFFSSLWSDISEVFSPAAEWFSETVWSPVSEAASGVWESVTGFFSDTWSGIQEVFSPAAEWFSGIWQSIQDDPVLSTIADIILAPYKLIYETIREDFNALVEFFTTIWQLISGDITLSEAGEKILGIFTGLWEDIQEAFSGVFNWFVGIGEEILNGLTSGVEGLWETTKEKVTGFFSNIWDGVKNFFGIHSPSTLAAEAGGNVMKGFSEGADEEQETVGQKLKGVFEGIWEVAKKAWDGVTGWLGKLFGWGSEEESSASTAENNATTSAENIASGVTSAFEDTDVCQPVTDSANAAVEALKTLGTTATSVASSVQSTFKTAWDNVVASFHTNGINFTAIVKGIKTVFRNLLNSMINGLNSVMSSTFGQINSRLSVIKGLDINGYKPFGGISSVRIPKIPALARGAVIPANHEFLALLGDQKSGTNIEAPLDTIVEAMQIALATNGNNAMAIANAVRNALTGLSLKMDKSTVGYVIADAINTNRRLAGKVALDL